MSYLPKRLGEDDPCADNPDDPVCQEFYAPPPPAPESGGVFTGFADMIKKGVAAITGAPEPTVATASAAAPTVSKSSLMPVVLVVGGGAALWFFLRKKK